MEHRIQSAIDTDVVDETVGNPFQARRDAEIARERRHASKKTTRDAFHTQHKHAQHGEEKAKAKQAEMRAAAKRAEKQAEVETLLKNQSARQREVSVLIEATMKKHEESSKDTQSVREALKREMFHKFGSSTVVQDGKETIVHHTKSLIAHNRINRRVSQPVTPSLPSLPPKLIDTGLPVEERFRAALTAATERCKPETDKGEAKKPDIEATMETPKITPIPMMWCNQPSFSYTGMWKCKVNENVGRPRSLTMQLGEHDGKYWGSFEGNITILGVNLDGRVDFQWQVSGRSVKRSGWWDLSGDGNSMNGIYTYAGWQQKAQQLSWRCERQETERCLSCSGKGKTTGQILGSSSKAVTASCIRCEGSGEVAKGTQETLKRRIAAVPVPNTVVETKRKTAKTNANKDPEVKRRSPSCSPAPLSKIPDDFVCPLTLELMADPVIAADSITYERIAIQSWMSKKKTSPSSGQDLQHEYLIQNLALKNVIETWKKANPGWEKFDQ